MVGNVTQLLSSLLLALLTLSMLCSMFEEHHNMVFNVLWEMVVSSNMDLKVNAAKLLKMIVSQFSC